MDTALIWFLVGLGLVLAELAVPGVILVFIGVAAWLVAILDWIGVDSFSVQLWIFGITSIVLVFGARRFVKGWFSGKESSENGDIDEEFVGKIVTVVSAIDAGDFGLVELKGARWKATSEVALEEGSQAVVTARDNITLEVAPRS
ncbi:MAG: NfeD family protein [Verrucomicrobiales bacterium]|nr:NfeD family protein [Verrucomicrobiales bacterium]